MPNYVHEMIPLSEQNLVDCVPNYCCEKGEWPINALKLISDQGGIQDGKSYPYEAEKEDCRFDKEKSVFHIKGGIDLFDVDEESLKKLIAVYGPVCSSMHASKEFRKYGSKLPKPELYKTFYGSDCKYRSINHSVVIVGYGTDEDGIDYWLVVSDMHSSKFRYLCKLNIIN